jgi:iron-sulfur cluster assembly protein
MITKEMTIEQVFETYSDRAQILAQEMSNLGLNCVGCSAATYETLEAGVLGHGLSEADLNKLLERLNEVVSQDIDTKSVTITKRGADKFREIAAEDGKEGAGLRLSDTAGGCSGYEYVLDFSEGCGDNDVIFESNGLEIHIDKDRLERLMGCMIDYMDGLNGSGFKITNPNVRGSCGCGKSQSY